MRDHQKYFAVEDAAGKLAPHFLTVTNIALDAENVATIRQGNERVLRARFNDARFFWEFDQRTPLVDRVKLLENVTFQKDLGSYAKKSEVTLELAHRIAHICELNPSLKLDREALSDAVRLSKTDLTTELVKEFTELQGVIGGLYAASQGFSKTVSQAIYDQYIPANSSDRVPRSIEGAILGIADRASTIAMMFSIGQEPTGSKDPLGLRRAANGIVKILVETEVPIGIRILCGQATEFLNEDSTFLKMLAFFAERVDFYLREARGQAYDVVKAVMASGYDDLRDTAARAEAVTAMRGSEDFLAVCAAFKRMKNILAQAEASSSTIGGVSSAFDSHAATIGLHERANAVSESFANFSAQRNYVGALKSLAGLRIPIDAFFDQVMVMDPDEKVRAVRLGLLQSLVQTFSTIADFSEIVTAG
jgi:glycyl-tRNA synthetase beta chain